MSSSAATPPRTGDSASAIRIPKTPTGRQSSIPPQLIEAMRARLLDVLKNEGFIRGYAEVEVKGHKELEIELKYHEGEPVIRELKRVSTPGRRVYSSVSDLKPHRQGLGVSILSTPQGVMTDTSAREKNVGGEVLCQVF